jgi:hypothetical protein
MIKMKSNPLRLYRSLGLAMALAFAVVGLVFAFLPASVLEFFNRLSPSLGLAPAPLRPGSFFPILATAYMVLVTALAWLMFRQPANPCLPQLLALGKLASALLSLAYFFAAAPYLVCLANAVVDGGIGMLALGLRALQKKHAATWPT